MNVARKDWPTSIPPFKSNAPKGAVGVVIPMRDGLKFFKLAFHSVLDFTDYPYSLTIVNNMSSYVTQKYLWAISKNHPVNVLPFQQDFNFAAEVNLGLRFAFADQNVEYGVILNQDVVVEPDWLSRLLDPFSDEKTGIVGPVTNIAIPTQQRPKNPHQRFEVDRLSGFCMAIRRKTFEDLNGFDETFRGGGFEDEDFCLRASRAGWKLIINPAVYIHHFWRAIRGTDPRAEGWMNENRALFYKKHPDRLKVEATV
jgi:GT2 family glycosyltransferase